jgi:hypothetical protein
MKEQSQDYNECFIHLTVVWNSGVKYQVRDCCTGTEVIAAKYLNIISGIFTQCLRIKPKNKRGS